MTASPGTPDMWQETFLFSVETLDGAEIQFAGITEEITTLPDMTKDIEGKVLANEHSINLVREELIYIRNRVDKIYNLMIKQ